MKNHSPSANEKPGTFLENTALFNVILKLESIQRARLVKDEGDILKLFSEIPQINHDDVAILKTILDNSRNVVKTNIKYAFQAETFDKLLNISKIPPNCKEYYLIMSLYLILTCFIFDKEETKKYFPKFIFILNKCVSLQETNEDTGLIFFLLFAYSVENKYDFDQETIEYIIIHFENNRTLKQNIYPYLLKFLKKILWSNDINSANKIIIMLSVLLADRREFLNDISEIELIIIPYALNFNINALHLLSYISTITRSDGILKTFKSIPAYLVNTIKDKENEISVDKKLNLIEDTDESFANCNPITDKEYRMFNHTFNTNFSFISLLSEPIQKIVSNLGTALSLSDNQCVFNFYTKFTDELSNIKEDEKYFNVLIVYIVMLSMNYFPEINSVCINKILSADIYDPDNTVFLNGSLPELYNEVRNQISVFIICSSVEQVIYFLEIYKEHPFAIAELALRLMYKKKDLKFNFMPKDTLMTFLKQIDIIRENQDPKYSKRACDLAKAAIFNFCAYFIDINPSEYFAFSDFCSLIMENIYHDDVYYLFEMLITDIFTKNDAPVFTPLIPVFKKILEKSNKNSSRKLICLFDKISTINELFVNAIQSSLLLIFREASLGGADLLVHALKMLNSISIFNDKYKPSMELICSIYKYIVNVEANESLSDVLISLLAKSRIQRKSIPFIVLREEFSLLFFALSDFDIDLFINLVKYSNYNARKLHSAKFDYVLLRLLKGEDFKLYGMKIKARKVNADKIMKYMEVSLKDVCTPEIINMICSIIKNSSERCVAFRFIRSLVHCNCTAGKCYEIGTVDPLVRIEGLPSDNFNKYFAISVDLVTDPALFQTFNSKICIASIEDENGTFIRFVLKNTAFMIEYGTPTAKVVDVISQGLQLDTETLLNMSVILQDESPACVCTRNKIALQLISMNHIHFTTKIKVFFGGSEKGNAEPNIVFGKISSARIYDRPLENNESRPDDYIWSLVSLNTSTISRTLRVPTPIIPKVPTNDKRVMLQRGSPVPTVSRSRNHFMRSLTPPPLPGRSKGYLSYKSNAVSSQNVFECFKTGFFITKFLKAIFSTKENIKNIASDGLMALSILKDDLRESKHFFGIGEFISSHIFDYECGSYKLYISFVNSINGISLEGQQEFFNKVILSLTPWASSPYTDLIKIIRHWNSQLVVTHMDLFKRRSFVGRLFAELELFLTNAKTAERFNEDEKKAIINALSKFLCKALQIKFDKSDEETIISFTAISKVPSVFAYLLKDLSKFFVHNAKELKILLHARILDSNSEIASYSAIALTEISNVDQSIEALIISEGIRPDAKRFLCNYLIDNLSTYINSFTLLCAIANDLDEDTKIRAVNSILSNTNSILDNVSFSSSWFVFPLFLTINIPTDMMIKIYSLVARIAIKKGANDVARCITLAEIISVRPKIENVPNNADLLLSAIADENPTGEVAEIIFALAISLVFYTINGQTHKKTLMDEFEKSPYASFCSLEAPYLIDNLHKIKNVNVSKFIVTWRNDSNSVNNLKIARQYEKYNTYSSELMDLVDLIQTKKEVPENNTLYELYKTVFYKIIDEDLSIILSCFNSLDSVKKESSNNVNEYEKIYIDAELFVAPNEYKNNILKDRTTCYPFCPIKTKIQKHNHKYPVECRRPYEDTGVKCEVVIHKISKKYYFSYDSSYIYLDNTYSAKRIPLRNIIMTISGAFSEKQSYLEVYTIDNQCMMILFQKNKAFVDSLIQGITVNTLSIVPNKVYTLWLKGALNNFEFLMYLNILSGRSFNNVSLYPLMPKPFSDYNTLKPAENLSEITNVPSSQVYDKRSKCPMSDIVNNEVLQADLFFDPTISDIDLPKCAQTPYKFISLLRKALESESVTAALPAFVNKMWGVDKPQSFPHAKLFTTKIKPKKNNAIKAPFKLCANNGEIIWAGRMNDGNSAIAFSNGNMIVTNPSSSTVLFQYKCQTRGTKVVINNIIHEFSENEHNIYLRDSVSKETPCKGELFTSTGDYLIYVQNQTSIICGERSNAVITTNCYVTTLAASSVFNAIVYATADGFVHFHSLRSGMRTNKSQKFKCNQILITRGLGFILCKGKDKIRVFDVNGNFLRDLQITATKLLNVSYNGDDGIIITDGKKVSYLDVCDPENVREVKVDPDIIFSYADESSAAYIFINGSGKIEILPYSTICL